MTNETKQPTLPEVLVKVRDKIDMISISSLTHPRVKTVADEALSLLDSVQITSEPVAEYKVHPFGNGMPSLQWHPSFDLKLGTKLFDHAKPCARCAESEASESQLINQRDEAEEYGTRLANAVSEFFRVEVGEYSSANDPREIALDILEGGFVTDSDADRKLAALEAENAKSEAAWRELDSERVDYLNGVGDVLGQNDTDESLVDAAKRVMAQLAFQKKAWEADFVRMTRMEAAIERMRIAGGKEEFQKAFDDAKDLL